MKYIGTRNYNNEQVKLFKNETMGIVVYEHRDFISTIKLSDVSKAPDDYLFTPFQWFIEL